MGKPPNNRIIQYIEDTIYLKKNHDGEGLLRLQEEGREKYVTLEDVGQAFLNMADELTTFIDANQGLMEIRLLAVISALDTKAQADILKIFAENEDDLLQHLQVEEQTDNGKED